MSLGKKLLLSLVALALTVMFLRPLLGESLTEKGIWFRRFLYVFLFASGLSTLYHLAQAIMRMW